MIKGRKMIEMSIRKCLPENLTYSQKCEILEKLAEEYRAKSRKHVYESSKFRSKAQDYEGIIQKEPK